MDWLKDKMWQLNDVFEQFPSVWIILMLAMVFAVAGMFVYPHLLIEIANFKIITSYPFQELIIKNIDILRWGIVVVPMIILLIGISLAHTRYQVLIYRHAGYRGYR